MIKTKGRTPRTTVDQNATVAATANSVTSTANTTGNTKPRQRTAAARQDVDPEMRHLGIGVDTARYGHHVTFLREDKQLACPSLTVMETRDGYQQLQQRLEELRRRFPNAHLHLRIDAAGQYAANLESFVRSLKHLPLTVSVGEPKRNKDYHRAHSPKHKSDSTESHAMARYAVVERPEASYGKPALHAALRRVASRLEGQTKNSTRLINQLHETLSNSFPELATLISDVTAGWVLLLLEKYPTTERLAVARLATLQKIPFIPKEMAETLQNAAKASIGTLTGDVAEALIAELVSELRHSLAEEKRWRELLFKAFDALPDGPHQQIATINGIGQQTAAALVATAVDIKRFKTAKDFIGYYGVFPEEMQSGVDKFGKPIPAGKKMMCRKGNDLVRGLLWNCAKCASSAKAGNPAVSALYARRLAAGDSPQTAWGYCMTKLLRQVFGVWTSDQPFNPKHEDHRQTGSQEGANGQTGSHEAALTSSSPEVAAEMTVAGVVTAAQTEFQSETEASGHREKSQPTRSRDQEVTEASAPSLEPVLPEATEPARRRPLDYAALREQIPLQSVLEQISSVAITRVQHRGPCPIHQPTVTTSRKFSANLERQIFRCFDPSCGVQGNVLDLWQAYRKLPIYEAAEDLAKTFGIELCYLTQPLANKLQKHSGHHPPSA